MSSSGRGVLAFALVVAFALIAVGWRAARQYRRTGSTGLVVARNRREQVADALYLSVGIAALVVPVLAIAGFGLGTPATLSSGIVAIGVALALASIATTVWSQVVMGASWRVGVDHDTPGELVTDGPFRYVRNPIYTSMFAFTVAIAVLLPGVATIAIVAAAIASGELHVRTIEEPFLVTHYGVAYRTWASTTGRFVPGMGRRVASPR
jgi:protein-S-isoprenylcysteine O-methyltransferase Ste14